jgi:UDP-N-acetylmuramate dehydrogenase
MPLFLLGAGSNVLVSDLGIRGLVIKNRAQRLEREEGPSSELMTLYAESGVTLARLARETAREGLGGLEWAVGIPGTLGGAVVCNAGAYGGCIGDVLRSVEVITPEGDIHELNVDELGLGYRHSNFDWNKTILSLRLALRYESMEALEARIVQYTAQRRRSQPSQPSAGSVFKNPPHCAAGWLIEQAGLKGYRLGDAQISPKHANFIVNLGRAKAAEVRALMQLAQEKVQERFNIQLEPEIELVGE